jgi:cytidine deaminase
MNTDYSELLKAAAKAATNSYAPYGKVPRGAALLARDGTSYSGCAVEIASYAGSICPELAALSQALVQGRREFEAIAVSPSGWPCGLCRQALSEFGIDLQVISTNSSGAIAVTNLAELLPHSFGKAQL